MQLRSPVSPFAEVNVNKRDDGQLDIKATILVKPRIEGALAGIALDGSISMELSYGIGGSPLLQARNIVEGPARAVTRYLAEFSSNGKVELIYWACGLAGDEIQRIGQIDESDTESMEIKGPDKFGRAKTICLPAIKHMVEQLSSARWSVAVIMTDGLFDDFDEIVEYSWQLAEEINSGQRNFVKLVAVGLLHTLDKNTTKRISDSLGKLDDMFDECRKCKADIPGGEMHCPKCGEKVLTVPEGSVPEIWPDETPIDLWDHKIADDITDLVQLFGEVVNKYMIVAPEADIVATNGDVVMSYPNPDSEGGMPAFLTFTLPAGSRSFTLRSGDQQMTQDISEALD